MDRGQEGSTVITFPGMGPAAFPEIMKFMLTDRFVRPLIGIANGVLGYSLVDRYRESEGDYSEFAQISFLLNCLALARHAEERFGIDAEFCVGPSFGEKTAAVYVGTLSVPDAVWMTARIAQCMEEYFREEHQDVVTLSFVRTPEDRLEKILAELEERGEWCDISCYLDHDFYMLSVREETVPRVKELVRGVGGMHLYTMRPPMHSSAFAGLRERVAESVFSELTFADPRMPLVSDQDGELVTSGAGVRELLLDSFVRPLRWPHAVQSLRDRGVTRMCVAGPDALFGRVGTTTRNFDVVPVGPRAALRPRRGGLSA
jgi:[acyl-carrier-protein] S-malonyltransferase